MTKLAMFSSLASSFLAISRMSPRTRRDTSQRTELPLLFKC